MELTQDLIERWGEETQIEMIIETSLKLALTLQQFKQIDKKENYLEYCNSYNEVCLKIAEMKLSLELSEFIFNKNEIDKYQDLVTHHLKEKLQEY